MTKPMPDRIAWADDRQPPADPLVDLDSHHIEGVLNDEPVSIPLVSHIEGNLWVGGCLDGVRLRDEFRYVLALHSAESYRLGTATQRWRVRMYDLPYVSEHSTLGAAKFVVELLGKGQTLVHCQAGLNRSGLVAATALMMMGKSAEEAITLLRAKRHELVLCNSTFEQWLRAYVPQVS